MEQNKFFWENSEIKLFASLLAVLLVFLFLSLVADAKNPQPNKYKPLVENSFGEVVIRAKAAYVYDVRTQKVLFAHDENKRLPLASLTKVMSAVVASEMASSTTTIVISTKALEAYGDSGLLVGDRWSMKDLLDFSLTTSSNDGMRAIALSLGSQAPEENMKNFIQKMNRKAHELGMLNTYFYNEAGLDESDLKGGAYGTAKDLTHLFEYILNAHPMLLEATQKRNLTISSLNQTYNAVNTNTIAEEIPGLIGSKTGFTDIAGGNLMVVFDPEIGRPIIIAVLGSTGTERFKDVGILVEKTIQYINRE
ncbi:MAG: serine hydrolase [Parcubacteria group bacterium]